MANASMQKLISFVITASRPLNKKGAPLEYKFSESAPRYSASSLPAQFDMGTTKMKVGERDITFHIRSFPPENILVEAEVEVDDIFAPLTLTLREQLVEACYAIAKKRGGESHMSEEYSVALVSGYTGDPEQFLTRKQEITAFLKSERIPLDPSEIDYTISKQIKYAKDDLVIVDWDGAFVFDTHGEVDDIIDLLQTANLQLLRYRTLDRELDDRLHKVTRFANLTAPEKTLSARNYLRNSHEMRSAFREVINVRAKAIDDFEAIDRDIKLIGDWYSARLYELASKKFKLDEWKKTVQEKLDSLEDIYGIVAENFSVSRFQFLELLQIILFFILQVGWFVLIILEFFYFTR